MLRRGVARKDHEDIQKINSVRVLSPQKRQQKPVHDLGEKIGIKSRGANLFPQAYNG